MRIRVLASVASIACVAASIAHADGIQIVHAELTWPDQGIGILDPNGDRGNAAFVYDMLPYKGQLLICGGFIYAGGTEARCLALWDGANWSALSGESTNGSINAALEFDNALYVIGNFTFFGSIETRYIAKWDGETWSPLGAGFNASTSAIQDWDDGTGRALYVGGDFNVPGGKRISKWDGLTWKPLGTGCSGGGVRSLAVFDDGAGSALYVGGGFSSAGGVPAAYIAKWDGKQWSALGAGLNGGAVTMAVFDDGTGPALYVGGWFDQAGGIPAMHIARWDGKTWSAVGDNSLTEDTDLLELKVLDTGDGPALYAVGWGVLRKWDGHRWTAYDSPLVYQLLRTIELFDGPTGPTLHVGGSFMTGELPDFVYTNIARVAPGYACGDFDEDGDVDQADLGILLAAFNCNGPKGCAGDADGDGDVDQEDLGILLANFGQKCG